MDWDFREKVPEPTQEEENKNKKQHFMTSKGKIEEARDRCDELRQNLLLVAIKNTGQLADIYWSEVLKAWLEAEWCTKMES